MNVTININLPADSSKLSAVAAIERTAARKGDPITIDAYEPANPDNGVPLQGGLVAMLVLALTRGTTSASYSKDPNLGANRGLYEIIKNDMDTGKNAIDVFDAFISSYSDQAGLARLLRSTQKLCKAYRKYCGDQGIWDESCEITYKQLALIAEIKWSKL